MFRIPGPWEPKIWFRLCLLSILSRLLTFCFWIFETCGSTGVVCLCSRAPAHFQIRNSLQFLILLLMFRGLSSLSVGFHSLRIWQLCLYSLDLLRMLTPSSYSWSCMDQHYYSNSSVIQLYSFHLSWLISHLIFFISFSSIYFNQLLLLGFLSRKFIFLFTRLETFVLCL